MSETIGQQLVRLLGLQGVDTVFGIPGAHTIELYRGLADSGIHHVTPRHEQGAGFMADGYARRSGKPGVAFVITGPGMLNIATPMAQAMADSVPLLVIAGVNPRRYLGMGSGNLHELHRQSQVADSCSVLSHTLSDARQLHPFLHKAFALFQSARPGPVYLEVPVDLFAEPAAEASKKRPVLAAKPSACTDQLMEIAALLSTAKAPVILAGGGAATAHLELSKLAETVDAPVVQTTNARGTLPSAHPLSVAASPSLRAVRELVSKADMVLALGTEIGSTDYDMYEREDFNVSSRLVRVDIDAKQVHSGTSCDVPVVADCQQFLTKLLPLVNAKSKSTLEGSGAARTQQTLDDAWRELGEEMQGDCRILQLIRQHFPTQTIVGDSTQLIYAGNLYGGAPAPKRWFNSSTGFGALGYGVPAAIGSAIADRDTTVCLIGDGGLQFCLAELAVAVQEQCHVVFIVWNNQGYGEIERYMRGAHIKRVGVELHTPNFVAIAEAMGLDAYVPKNQAEFETAMAVAKSSSKATLIELDETIARNFEHDHID